MKPFNLEEAKAGKKVCTREGEDVEIIKFDFNPSGNYFEKGNLIAIVKHDDGKEDAFIYSNEGISATGKENHNLFMKTEKREGWINLYKARHDNKTVESGGGIYNSENEAKEHRNDKLYFKTVKIEWEE